MRRILPILLFVVVMLLLFPRSAFAQLYAPSTDPSPIRENNPKATLTIYIPPDDLAQSSNWKVQTCNAIFGKKPDPYTLDKNTLYTWDNDRDGRPDAVYFTIINDDQLNGTDCEFKTGLVEIELFKFDTSGKEISYGKTNYVVEAKNSRGDIKITIPSAIYRGQPFSVDYSGAKNNGCYGVFSTPPLPIKTSVIRDPSCNLSGSYISGKFPSSGQIAIEGIPTGGSYRFSLQGSNSRQGDFAEIDFKVVDTPATSTDPSVSLLICVYPKGTTPPSSPPITGCGTRGTTDDIFIASGEINNVSSPSNMMINLWYAIDFKNYTSLTNFFPDASGSFNIDISSDIKKINVVNATGTIGVYANVNISGKNYNSSPTTVSITNLPGVIAIPTSTLTPFPPPCNKWVRIDDPRVEKTQKEFIELKADDRKHYRCIELATGLGIDISTEPVGFVKSLFGILLSVSGGIALLLIIYSGYQIMFSQGDAEKVKGAKETITSAIVGLLFIIFSLVILQVIGVDILKIPGFEK